MNLILLFDEDFNDDSGCAVLTDRRFIHIRDVLSVKIGDELSVGRLNGMIGKGRVVKISEGSVELEVTLDQPPLQPCHLNLILALPRPKVMRRIFKMVSILGIKRLYLINAYRVEKSFWQSPHLHSESIKHNLLLGLEQSRDTILPEVSLHHRFKPLVEDDLPNIIRGTMPLVAEPKADEPCPSGLKGNVTLAVGPEGGFIPYEVDMLKASGFTPINIGERILNVETTIPFLTARLFG